VDDLPPVAAENGRGTFSELMHFDLHFYLVGIRTVN